jgi:lactoylglutathione lyase
LFNVACGQSFNRAISELGERENFALIDVEHEGLGALGAAIDSETKHNEQAGGAPNLKSSRVGRNKITMIKKLLHTRYRVSDLEKTVSFYRDVLGLEEVRRHTSGRGSQLVFLKAPGSEEEIELCKFDESGPVLVGPDLTHLAFEVDNIEEFARQTAAKGYPLSDGPHPNGRGGAIAFIDAPEGYEIELIQHGPDR